MLGLQDVHINLQYKKWTKVQGKWLITSVVDTEQFDPDPTCNVDPDPNFTFTKREKCASKSSTIFSKILVNW